MSTSLAKVSQLKAEIRLAQIISQFESELSNEQKATFRTQKSQTLDSPPNINDVMRLTTEIDRQMSRKTSGRCFGPRFTNFLQGVQQFAALGDVIVGGSQNIIACSVWALVRISLLSFTNFLSYFDKLSLVFMKIGRSAPRYENMAILYPRSKVLQNHLSEYFIVAVSFCHSLMKFTKQSALRKVASSLNDLDIKTFQADLDDWANAIRDEVSLLVAKRIEEEAKENFNFRTLSSRLFKSSSYQQTVATNLRVLDFCSKYDNMATWKQIRKSGNTAWHLKTDEYHKWKSENQSCTIVCIGKLGSGKSVLLANLIADLSVDDQSVPREKVVAYFFCRHDLPESLYARTVLGSLTRQILRTIPNLSGVAHLCDETNPTLAFKNLLLNTLSPKHKVYLVLDGLNECDGSQRQIVELALRELQKSCQILLCLSERVEPTSRFEGSERFAKPRVISIPENNPDIESYIDAELESCLSHNKLVIGDPSLILEIRDVLAKKSQGMFLWVALQIQSLCAMKTDQAIKEALADLPKNLSETYSRILQRAGESGRTYQRQILQLVTVAYRYLTVSELREALSVIPGDSFWTPSRLLNDVFSALACCGCLLVIDEEDSTIRFVHYSVKKFLIDHFIDSSQNKFTMEQAQQTMADIIVTYLSYNVFETRLATTKLPQIPIQATASAIIRSTKNPSSSNSIQKLALNLLKSRKQPNFDISRILADAHNPLPYQSVEEFHFYPYARSHWLQHILYVSGQDEMMYNLSVKIIQRGLEDAHSDTKDIWTPLHWASQHGNESIIKLLFEEKKIDVNWKNSQGQPLLWCAILATGTTIMNALLDQKDININVRNLDEQTPLTYAAEYGIEKLVKTLLNNPDVDVNSQDRALCTPLHWATKRGHVTVVKMLLRTRKVDLNLQDLQYQTPLHIALDTGKIDSNYLLVAEDIDVNLQDRPNHHTPLHLAAREGRTDAVKWLVGMKKADVNLSNVHHQTALHVAARNGHTEVIKKLLSVKQLNCNLQDRGGNTALHMAAEKGYTGIVKLLVGSAAPDMRDTDGKLVLKTVPLALNLDPDLPNKASCTPLYLAAQNGHTAIVKLLLESGKVNADRYCLGTSTPLSVAALNGHSEVVDVLSEFFGPASTVESPSNVY